MFFLPEREVPAPAFPLFFGACDTRALRRRLFLAIGCFLLILALEIPLA
jgi:hypothetical protein